MSSGKFLEYEVALLLAKYGKGAVLSVLAKQLNQTVEQLESTLQNLPSGKPSHRAGKRPTLDDVVAQLAQQHSGKAPLLRTLQARLENRSLFPELKDVKRFFDRRGRALGPTKSRAESLPKVLRLLADLDASDLEGLCQMPTDPGRSSLGLISDEILRRDR